MSVSRGDVMDINQFIKNSQQFIWFIVNEEGEILDSNVGFQRLFQHRASDITLDTYIEKWQKSLKKIPSFDYYRLNNNIICDSLSLYSNKVNDHYEFYGEMPIYNDHESFNKMSDMNQELTNLTREINRKNVRLEKLLLKLRQTQSQIIQDERMVGLGRIAAGIAHEINNPLGIVISNMDFLCETMKDIRRTIIDKESFELEELKEDFIELSEVGEEIHDALNRIKEIVSAFRDYSDLDRMSGNYSFNVQSGIENTIQLQKSTLEDIKIVTHVEDELFLEARGSELNQVFGHILNNAVLALENEGDKLIDINGYRNKGNIVLEFIDNGVGMKEETLKHAFDPFYTTRDVGKGKGIGLSICYDIINNNYQGNIEISSEISKGTKVTIIIPEEVRHARKNDE